MEQGDGQSRGRDAGAHRGGRPRQLLRRRPPPRPVAFRGEQAGDAAGGAAGHASSGALDPRHHADRRGRGLCRPRPAHPRRDRRGRALHRRRRRRRAARPAAGEFHRRLRRALRGAAGAGIPRALSRGAARPVADRRGDRPRRRARRYRPACRADARFLAEGPQDAGEPARHRRVPGLSRAPGRAAHPAGTRRPQLPALQLPPLPGRLALRRSGHGRRLCAAGVGQSGGQ